MFWPIRASGRATTRHADTRVRAVLQSAAGWPKRWNWVHCVVSRNGIYSRKSHSGLKSDSLEYPSLEGPTRVRTMKEAVLPCQFSDVENHRGVLARFAVGWSISSSCRTSSGVAAVGIPFPTNFDHGWLTWADKAGISDKASVIIPRKGSYSRPWFRGPAVKTSSFARETKAVCSGGTVTSGFPTGVRLTVRRAASEVEEVAFGLVVSWMTMQRSTGGGVLKSGRGCDCFFDLLSSFVVRCETTSFHLGLVVSMTAAVAGLSVVAAVESRAQCERSAAAGQR
jgi:hypothetical protein